LRGDDGRFVSLARSNVIRTPRAWPVVGVEEHFMRIERAPERAESVPPPVYVKPRPARPAALSSAAPAAGEPARDAAAPVLKKLTEFRASRLRGAPIGIGAAPIAATPPASFAERGADLTEMAEQAFVPGLSSAMAPGTRAED
jgi:hypothetical protein